MSNRKRCFVIQGFGKKQDYEQGKHFNLDASYVVIRQAVESAGIECFRADELRGNAIIDKRMYNELLAADLVIADITTLNFNAAYELGVRHALRPYATLVVGEEGMNFPFDVNHIYIHTYKHLGEDIGYGEAVRFGKELSGLAQQAVGRTSPDSPVYVFLTQLPANGFLGAAANVREGPRTRVAALQEGTTLREIIAKAELLARENRFQEAVEYWERARKVAWKDDYIVQQLAFATYKSEHPDPESALRKARQILEYLKPHGSFDSETLRLWAAVHKRIYEIADDAPALDEAIFALERGFFIKRDYYNGINLAFLLDTKATRISGKIGADLRAVARHIRRNVKQICEHSLALGDLKSTERYWVLATMYEACVGLGEEEEAARWRTKAEAVGAADWMKKSTGEQVTALREMCREERESARPDVANQGGK